MKADSNTIEPNANRSGSHKTCDKIFTDIGFSLNGRNSKYKFCGSAQGTNVSTGLDLDRRGASCDPSFKWVIDVRT